MQKTLINRAFADIRISTMLSDSTDEYDLDVSAYHTQQAIEKALKYYLEQSGISYPKSHNIELLSELCADQMVVDILDGKEWAITAWEAGSRYAGNFKVAKNQLEAALKIAKELYSYIVSQTSLSGC